MWQTATRQAAGCRGLAGLSAILYPEIGSTGLFKNHVYPSARAGGLHPQCVCPGGPGELRHEAAELRAAGKALPSNQEENNIHLF